MQKINDSDFVGAINRIAATEDGHILFAYMKSVLGWDDVYVSNEEPNVTQYYAARRGVYGALRKVIAPEHLKKIEFNYERKADEHDGTSTRKHSISRKRTGKRTSTGTESTGK